MPIYQLTDESYWFPEPEEFEGDIIGVGGDLRPGRLIQAYSKGIFPWYNDPGEMLWWCPEKRCVLFLTDLKISHSMRNVFKKNQFTFTMDTDFMGVLNGCRGGEREGATWLIDEMVEANMKLHEMGLSHSLEVWQDGELVGGLYGASFGEMFFGESMFSRVPNSSKAAFILLANHLKRLGWFMLDCQVYTDHLGSMGATVLRRDIFLTLLEPIVSRTTKKGKWTEAFAESVATFNGKSIL
jgi:leucyl/phenylalanyl-tRNA---protein transferase